MGPITILQMGYREFTTRWNELARFILVFMGVIMVEGTEEISDVLDPRRKVGPQQLGDATAVRELGVRLTHNLLKEVNCNSRVE